jgi:hypothetical protein
MKFLWSGTHFYDCMPFDNSEVKIIADHMEDFRALQVTEFDGLYIVEFEIEDE